jgi:hypothetical protein
VGYMLVHIILPAVCAYPGRDIFHDKGHPVPVKRDRGCTLFRFAVFADYALHDLLRVKLSDHESGSGSYAVITIVSIYIIVCHYHVEWATVHHSRDKKTGIGNIIRIFFYNCTKSQQFTNIGIRYSPLEHLA